MFNRKIEFVAALLIFTMLLTPFTANVASAERLKDISSLKGVRGNQLIGYGLVVGLKGSGDKSYKSPFTIQTLLSMLEKLGTTVDVRKLVDPRLGVSDVRQLRDVRVENVAAVMVTATLPPFAQSGSQIDVTVSSLGDARSLLGGTLLLTPLKAANGEIYAVAQGAVSVGGAIDRTVSRRVSYAKNHTTVAKISSGAIVEKEVGFSFESLNEFSFYLHNPDFTTINGVVAAINAALAGDFAKSPNPGTVIVNVPPAYQNKKVELIALLESLEVATDNLARVVMDERTGTIVIGEKVKIDKVAISHGNLTIRIGGSDTVSQPPPFSAGQTIVVPETILGVEEVSSGNSNRVMEFDSGASIGDMVKALNALGVSPRDLIAIFQTLKSAGALQAAIEII